MVGSHDSLEKTAIHTNHEMYFHLFSAWAKLTNILFLFQNANSRPRGNETKEETDFEKLQIGKEIYDFRYFQDINQETRLRR